MFWNGNYTVVREISSLLKNENVTLSQLLEADDILQECHAELKQLVAFLTRPEVVAELVGLIIEEPSKNVELQSQYRYSAVAAEILTMGICALNDHLSADTVQMHRLCDFLNREPPLNPLLASFFSKTIKCLLEQSPKQDWYIYHIVGLRTMGFLKSRADFLPNMYRHIGTSAICDLFKYFIRLDLFTSNFLEWFQEHQFLEVLIQMICGTYVAEELPAPAPAPAPPVVAAASSVAATAAPDEADLPEEINGEHADKDETNTTDDLDKGSEGADSGAEVSAADSDRLLSYEVEVKESRIAAARSANAAGLLCEIVLGGCYGEGCTTRPKTGAQLMAQCRSEPLINLLLQSMFTSPLEFRRHAVVNGVHVLLQLLQDDPMKSEEVNAAGRRAVVSAVAPHLPLLHQTLLQEPPPYPHSPQSGACVGVARLQVATLVAALTGSPAEEVASALVALGTLSTLLDLFFRCPGNNFLHAQTYQAISSALNNIPYQALYAKHLIIECDLLKRLMDVFEENLEKEGRTARSGYMGHVIQLLELLQQVLDERLYEAAGVPDALGVRWAQFKEDKMHPLYRETPLGGCHPADTNYETEPLADDASYDLNGAGAGGVEDLDPPDDNASDAVFEKFYSNYQYNQDQFEAYTSAERRSELGAEGARRVMFDNDNDRVWDDDYEDLKDSNNPKYPGEVLDAVSPWEAAGGEGGAAEGWAQFANAEDNDKFGGFVSARPDNFGAYWHLDAASSSTASVAATVPDRLRLAVSSERAAELQEAMRELSVAGGRRDPPLDNIEATVERQCEPMELGEDASPEGESPEGEAAPAER